MLSHTEMPTSLQGAEEAIKKHEDFLTTTEASEEKINGVVEAGRRLINEGNANSDKIDPGESWLHPGKVKEKVKLCMQWLSMFFQLN